MFVKLGDCHICVEDVTYLHWGDTKNFYGEKIGIKAKVCFHNNKEIEICNISKEEKEQAIRYLGGD